MSLSTEQPTGQDTEPEASTEISSTPDSSPNESDQTHTRRYRATTQADEALQSESLDMLCNPRAIMSIPITFKKCRFYSEEYPEIGDLTIGLVRKIASESGAHVDLVEYPGLSGLVIWKELSRRRIRSIRKVIQVGQEEVLEVIRVNKEKNYIDLSKKRVTPEEREETIKKYHEARRVYSILVQTCREYHQQHPTEPLLQPLDLYQDVIWKLPNDLPPMAYFQRIVSRDPSEPISPLIPEKYGLLEQIVQKLVSRPTYRLQQKVKVMSYAPDGVHQIKEGFGEIERQFGEQISIFNQTPPIYVLQLITEDQKAGQRILAEASQLVKAKFGQNQCQYQISGEPEISQIS